MGSEKKNAKVPAAQLQQKYHYAPVLLCSGYNFNTSFLHKNGEYCCYQKCLCKQKFIKMLLQPELCSG